MTNTSFAIVTLAVPIIAVVAAVLLSRFSDKVAKGFSLRARRIFFVLLALSYLIQAVVASYQGTKWQTLSYVAATAFWLAALWSMACGSRDSLHERRRTI